VEGRLSRLDTEIAQMRAEAEDSAKTEELRIRQASEDERNRIVQSAEQEIGRVAGAARRELQSFAAELAIDLAEKKIKVGQGADQILVRDFTGQIGKDGN
jgi:F-type H+-transporting ATPase subunit b